MLHCCVVAFGGDVRRHPGYRERRGDRIRGEQIVHPIAVIGGPKTGAAL
jgi:hypothetical protein